MREYYYLTRLEDSPYNLTLADVLHLGATHQLAIYVYVERWANMTAHQTGELAGEARFYLRITPEDLLRIEKNHHGKLLVKTDHGGLNEGFAVSQGIVDERLDGEIPFRRPIFPAAEPIQKVNVEDNNGYPIYCKVSELICWPDDLEKLANKGWIKRRTDDTNTAAIAQPDTDRQEYPRI